MFEAKRPADPNLFGVLIQPNSVYRGIHLHKISLPEGCVVLGILRSKQVILTEDNPALSAGDYILAMAIHPRMTSALKVILKRVHPVYYSLNDCLSESKPGTPNASNKFCSKEATKFTPIQF